MYLFNRKWYNKNMKGECRLENAACPFYPEDCHSNTDHLFWPRHDYKASVERKFRNLPENKRQICAFAHVLRHVNEAPPEKPSRDEMIAAIAQSAINIHPPRELDIMPPQPYEGLDEL